MHHQQHSALLTHAHGEEAVLLHRVVWVVEHLKRQTCKDGYSLLERNTMLPSILPILLLSPDEPNRHTYIVRIVSNGIKVALAVVGGVVIVAFDANGLRRYCQVEAVSGKLGR